MANTKNKTKDINLKVVKFDKELSRQDRLFIIQALAHHFQDMDEYVFTDEIFLKLYKIFWGMSNEFFGLPIPSIDEWEKMKEIKLKWYRQKYPMNQSGELLMKQKKIISKEELKEHLVGFQLYLHDKNLITNHDWDFEKLAKQYIKKERV